MPEARLPVTGMMTSGHKGDNCYEKESTDQWSQSPPSPSKRSLDAVGWLVSGRTGGGTERNWQAGGGKPNFPIWEVTLPTIVVTSVMRESLPGKLDHCWSVVV